MRYLGTEIYNGDRWILHYYVWNGHRVSFGILLMFCGCTVFGPLL